jgi:hypothetical protein
MNNFPVPVPADPPAPHEGNGGEAREGARNPDVKTVGTLAAGNSILSAWRNVKTHKEIAERQRYLGRTAKSCRAQLFPPVNVGGRMKQANQATKKGTAKQ